MQYRKWIWQNICDFSDYFFPSVSVNNTQNLPVEAKNANDDPVTPETANSGARTFTFRELAMATKNFRQECLLGEGGFGKVYKATLQSGEVMSTKTFITIVNLRQEFELSLIRSMWARKNRKEIARDCSWNFSLLHFLQFWFLRDSLIGCGGEETGQEWNTRE